MIRIKISLLIAFLPVVAFTQEYLTGIGNNPALQKAALQQESYTEKSTGEPMAMFLPFYDDFTQIGPYPDPLRWADNHVFINTDYAVNPPNRGVATFDALDSLGFVYRELGFFTGVADYLTAHPIRLDSVIDPLMQILKGITPADSVYFSFYFQPEGNGLAPSRDDSLALQFGYGFDVFDHFDTTVILISNYISPFDTVFPGDTLLIDCDAGFVIAPDTLFFDDQLLTPCDSVFRKEMNWTNVWSSRGDSINAFFREHGTYFKRVMLPLTDSAWFRSDFQFRFVNYASVSFINSWRSNTDQWNIDLVYLDMNRDMHDTAFSKIGFASVAPSFLEGYQEIPYTQYSQNPFVFMKDSISVLISNLDTIPHNCSYDYYFISGTDTIFRYDAGTENVSPFFSTGYLDYPPFSNPPVKTYFPANPQSVADSVGFETVHRIRDTEGNQLGDTITFVQSFRNFFAYDDGTAEVGYGLTPAGSMLAYRFDLVKPDTLRAISMFFNKVQDSANKRLFHLAVWNDNNGQPGNLLYLEENLLPVFPVGYNNFHTYHLQNDSIVFSGKIYIGWIQTTHHNLNIGFDRNNDASAKIFYNVEGTWINTRFEGALMMRPVFGRRINFQKSPPPEKNLKSLKIFPNPPASAPIVFIDLPDELNSFESSGKLETNIYNMFGQLIRKERFKRELDVSLLKEGVYIVTVVYPGSGKQFSQKLLINRRY